MYIHIYEFADPSMIALYEEGYREAEACYEDLLAYLEK